MKDMGWTATDFDIDYRDMVEEIESKVDGVIFCIEQESPYQFSGMGIVFNIQEARDVLFNYCQNIIKEKLANDPDFTPDKLTDDEEAAAKFFKAL
jgi:hypothetical protein